MSEAQIVGGPTGVVQYTTAGTMAGIYQANVEEIIRLAEDLQQRMGVLREAFPVERSGLRTFDLVVSVCGEDSPDKMRRELKRAAWASLISKLQLERVMSAKKREEMHEALGQDTGSAAGRKRKPKDPIESFPDITPENILEVLQTYASSAGEFLDESCREIYDWVKPYQRDEYKTNVQNRWKIGGKMIKSYALSDTTYGTYYHLYHNVERYYHTLDTIFHLLDGKGIPPNHRGPLCEAINGTRISGTGRGETEYFKFRCCKNRSLHLEFKRRDLVQAFNLRCGHPNELPGDDSQPYGGRYEADKVPFAPDGDFQFFQTPRHLAEAMVELAGVTKGSVVLEPSAGGGRIVRAADDAGGTVDCVEAQVMLATALENAGYNTTQGDFLEVKPVADYTHVIMNPPFRDGQAVAHIRHAWQFLKPGGVLVAIADKGVTYRSDKRTMAFREWLKAIGANVTHNPSGSFAESNTDVETVMIHATKSL